jgi:hypothetical protein
METGGTAKGLIPETNARGTMIGLQQFTSGDLAARLLPPIEIQNSLTVQSRYSVDQSFLVFPRAQRLCGFLGHFYLQVL